MERFWKKVRILSADECWEWLASRDKYGYGKSSLNGKGCSAHRVAYQLTFGPVARGMVIDHTCRNRGCVNPRHIRQVTPYQNLTENSINFVAVNKHKTHCPKGHAYDLIHPNSGARGCKVCMVDSRKKRFAKFYAKNRERILAERRGQNGINHKPTAQAEEIP